MLENLQAQYANAADDIAKQNDKIADGVRRTTDQAGRAWTRMARGMREDAEDLADDLVTNSIIPDMVNDIIRHVDRIGPAFEGVNDTGRRSFADTATSTTSRGSRRARARNTDEELLKEVRKLNRTLTFLLPDQMRRSGRFGAATSGRRGG
jgi:hypothetical protein